MLDSLLSLVSNEERKVMQSEGLDTVLLSHGAAIANKAILTGALTEAGIAKATPGLLDWPDVCSSLVSKCHHVLSEAALVQVSASALCGGTIQVLACPVPLLLLAGACKERLERTNASAANAARVLAQIAKADMAVVVESWPLGSAPWSTLIDGGGLASLESDEWFLAYSGLDWSNVTLPKLDELRRAAIVLELASNDVICEHHLAAALKVAICCGLGRSERARDDCGFNPVVDTELAAAFDKVAAVDTIRISNLQLLQSVSGTVLRSQGRFASSHLAVSKDVVDLPPQQHPQWISVRLAALRRDLSLSAAADVFLRLANLGDFTSWAQVDAVCGLGKVLQEGPHVGLSVEQTVGLARLLGHRCWQIQLASAVCLARLQDAQDDEVLLTACSNASLDAWGCCVAWWALLWRLSNDVPVSRKSRAASRLVGVPFARFAEAVFAFVDDNMAEGAIDSCVTLAEVRPHDAQDRSVLAGSLWFLAVAHLRTAARAWFTELQDKNLVALVTSFSSARVCGIISGDELAAAAAVSSEGLSLRVGARTVVASVEKDDVAVELTVTLPKLFPLQAVEVSATKGNLPESLLRRWVLSLTIMMLSSEGSLSHALREWGRTGLYSIPAFCLFVLFVIIFLYIFFLFLFLRFCILATTYFDSIDSCHICFCVLTEGGAIASLKCSNCNCAFHAECLAKWFATSHKSICCMCQLAWVKK